MRNNIANKSLLVVIALTGGIIIIVVLGIYFFAKQNPEKREEAGGSTKSQVIEGSDISIESKEYKVGIRDKKALLSVLNYTFHVFDALPDNDRSIKIIVTTKVLPATPENSKVQTMGRSEAGVYTIEMQIPRFLLEAPAPQHSLNPLNLQSAVLLNLPSKLSEKEVLELVKKLTFSNTHFFTLDWEP
jgi:hypothetical protein